MKSRTRIALKLTALLLCIGILVTIAPVNAFAESKPLEDVGRAPAAIALDENGEPEPLVYAAQSKSASQRFFDRVSFLYYKYDPSQHLVYNSEKAFQWIFGFNKFFDLFTAFMNVYADTTRFTFEYEGKDWLIQLWKGAYATVLAAGGEVGIYNKPTSRKIGHYDSARNKNELMGVKMSMYNNENYMFTREFGKRWWTTGYQVSLAAGIQSRTKPRYNLTMDTTIQLLSKAMADAFVKEIIKRGFRQVSAIGSFKDVDTFTQNGDTVRIIWRYINESYY